MEGEKECRLIMLHAAEHTGQTFPSGDMSRILTVKATMVCISASKGSDEAW